ARVRRSKNGVVVASGGGNARGPTAGARQPREPGRAREQPVHRGLRTFSMSNQELFPGNGKADLLLNGEPPTRVRYLVLAGGCSMALLAYVDRFGFAVFADRIGEDFGLSDQDMGYLMAAFLVSYGACQVPAGLAGDRFGARLLLTVFVVGWSVATAALGLV